MDKATLKDVLSQVNPGDTIEVAFAGSKTPLSGNFKVLSSKIGRGKCGSRIASLEAMTDNSVITIGTPTNTELVSVTYNGTKYGFNTSVEAAPGAKRDLDKANGIKDKLKGMVGFGGRQLRIASQEPDFNGTFTLVSAELSKGRYGQVRARLTNDATGQTVELWSYRHSGVIDSIDVVE
jgi:hypothetical protein